MFVTLPREEEVNVHPVVCGVRNQARGGIARDEVAAAAAVARPSVVLVSVVGRVKVQVCLHERVLQTWLVTMLPTVFFLLAAVGKVPVGTQSSAIRSPMCQDLSPKGRVFDQQGKVRKAESITDVIVYGDQDLDIVLARRARILE